jgi:5-methylcytosine-specific restriction endonuclease McrA
VFGLVIALTRMSLPDHDDCSIFRRCFLKPLEAHERAADLLSQAAEALLRGDLAEADDSLRKCDFICLQKHYRQIVGKIDPVIHHRTKNPVYVRLPPNPSPHMPAVGIAGEVLARDGYRCRFCTCKVVVKEARKIFAKVLPVAARLDDRGCQHSALAALRASIDHVVPFRRGGTNDPDNLVTTCGPCQFGRGHWLLEECDLEDPRKYPPLNDSWDGVIRLRGFDIKKLSPSVARTSTSEGH